MNALSCSGVKQDHDHDHDGSASSPHCLFRFARILCGQCRCLDIHSDTDSDMELVRSTASKAGFELSPGPFMPFNETGLGDINPHLFLPFSRMSGALLRERPNFLSSAYNWWRTLDFVLLMGSGMGGMMQVRRRGGREGNLEGRKKRLL